MIANDGTTNDDATNGARDVSAGGNTPSQASRTGLARRTLLTGAGVWRASGVHIEVIDGVRRDGHRDEGQRG